MTKKKSIPSGRTDVIMYGHYDKKEKHSIWTDGREEDAFQLYFLGFQPKEFPFFFLLFFSSFLSLLSFILLLSRIFCLSFSLDFFSFECLLFLAKTCFGTIIQRTQFVNMRVYELNKIIFLSLPFSWKRGGVVEYSMSVVVGNVTLTFVPNP